MFQAVCVTKKRSLGQTKTKKEALEVASLHGRRSGHIVRVFNVSATEPKSTGNELMKGEVKSATEVEIPPTPPSTD